jgi:hypothetical protein
MSRPDDPPEIPDDDPFEAHFRRDPMTGAGVTVLVVGTDPAACDRAGRGLVELLRSRKREAEFRTVDPSRFGPELERAARDEASLPLMLVTGSDGTWTGAHLDGLLASIDACDHAIGCRDRTRAARWSRRLKSLRWRVLFGVPVLDPLSPARIHRRDHLAAVPVQSASGLAVVEVLAKATFLGHLMDEVPIPPLPDLPASIDRAEVGRLFRHPTFVPASVPAEELEGEQERDDRPGGEHGQRDGDGLDPRPFEQDLAQGRDDVRER